MPRRRDEQWHPGEIASISHRPAPRIGCARRCRFCSLGAFLVLASVARARRCCCIAMNTLSDGQRPRRKPRASILGDHLARTVTAIDTTLEPARAAPAACRRARAANHATSGRPVFEAARAGHSRALPSLAVTDERGIVGTRPFPAHHRPVARGYFICSAACPATPAPASVADTPFRGQQTGNG